MFELGLEADEELLEMFYPLFNQSVRHNEMSLYRLIDTAVDIESGGMGGVSIRGSRNDTLMIFERKGYSGDIILGYIEEYERRTLEEYHKSTSKES